MLKIQCDTREQFCEKYKRLSPVTNFLSQNMIILGMEKITSRRFPEIKGIFKKPHIYKIETSFQILIILRIHAMLQ